MQLNLLVLSYVASAGIAGAVVAVAWRRRQLVGARLVALAMLAVCWWLIANALEAAALDRSAKILWSVVAYPGIESAPVLYLLFVLAWTRQDRALTRRRTALLMVVPAVSVAMAATNEGHHLLWTSVTLVDAWGVTAVYEHGPWFWVQAAYAYGLVGVALVALVVAIQRYPAVYARRIRLVIAAALAPVAGSMLYVLGLGASTHADLSSIAFAIAGLVTAWAVLRFGLLDIVPVSWPAVLDSLLDAVLVLDSGQRIATFNESATNLLGVEQDALGERVDLVLKRYPEVVALCHGSTGREVEVPVRPLDAGSPDGVARECSTLPTRWFAVRVTAISDERARDAGFLVALRDVTETRRMVETIRTLSLTDELTGLLNRRGFISLAEQQILTSVRSGNRLWLLFADLDGFKLINDRLGHKAGDQALCDVARLLKTRSFREADLVARLGGDEFAILATEISEGDEDSLVRRIDDAVRVANERDGRDFLLSLSVGVAVFEPDSPQTLDELIREADRRMYRAKQSRQATAHDRIGSGPSRAIDGGHALMSPDRGDSGWPGADTTGSSDAAA